MQQQQQQSRHAPSGLPNQPHSIAPTMDSPSKMDANPFGIAPLESQQLDDKDQFNQPVELPEMMYILRKQGLRKKAIPKPQAIQIQPSAPRTKNPKINPQGRSPIDASVHTGNITSRFFLPPTQFFNAHVQHAQYSKRILVVTDDIPGPVIRTILESSSSVPASIIYDGPLPIIGGRGRNGLQPARASENLSNSHTPTSEEIGPVQLSVQGVVNHLWLTPHLYYNVAHLTDDKQIHNGVCEVCHAEIGWLFFKRGTFENGVRVTETAVKGDGGRVDVAEMRRLEIAEKAVEMERLGMGMSSSGKSDKSGSKKVLDGQGSGKRKGGTKADASTSKDSKRARMCAQTSNYFSAMSERKNNRRCRRESRCRNRRVVLALFGTGLCSVL
ncbi:hypothetical protein BJ741DRAFT_594357 [Chytriomyces cf. hyalinus JEL632]|nr:hypothetical protein BJ741DRAFT_594357 [Chytriomyces cf. hyalinus JEL632]